VTVHANGKYIRSTADQIVLPPHVPASDDPVVVSLEMNAVFAFDSGEDAVYRLDATDPTRWHVRPLSVALGEALSATFDSVTQTLFVLESHASGKMQIRAIDPLTGQTQVVRNTELDHAANSDVALVATPDGGLVVGSSTSSGTLVIRFDVVSNGASPTSQVIQPGARLVAPELFTADEVGVSMVLESVYVAYRAVVGFDYESFSPASPGGWKSYL